LRGKPLATRNSRKGGQCGFADSIKARPRAKRGAREQGLKTRLTPPSLCARRNKDESAPYDRQAAASPLPPQFPSSPIIAPFPPEEVAAIGSFRSTGRDGWPPVTFLLQCSEYLAPSLQSLTSYPVIYYHFWRFGATAKDHVDPPDPKPPSEQFLWFEPFLHSRMTPRLAIALTAANTASRLRASRALQDRAGLSPIIRP